MLRQNDGIETTEKKWRLSKHHFEADGTLVYDENRDYILLRDLLDDPLGQKFLGKYSREYGTGQNLFFAWVSSRIL